MSNEDVASIEFRKFNGEEKDEYPQITICFVDMQGTGIFKKSFFNATGIKPEAYRNYLTGGFPDNNRLEFDDINFDDVAFNIHDDGYVTNMFSRIVKEGERSDEQMSLLLTMKTPDMMCYSKNVSFRRNVRYVDDVIILNRTLLYDGSYYLRLHIHKANQLLRSINSLYFEFVPNWYKTDLRYWLGINGVKVLRRREDSNTPCNESLTNEDAYVLGLVTEKIKCIPTYWKSFQSTLELDQSLPTCSGTQNREVYHVFISLLNGTDTLDGLYRPPCETMMISVTEMTLEGLRPNTVVFKRSYRQDSYKAIVNKKDVTPETLTSQVGGFVGK